MTTKARKIADIIGNISNDKLQSADLDVSFENISDTGTTGTKVASGTTAQRGSTTGQWRYNTTTGYFEGRNATGFATLEPSPIVSSVDVTEVDPTAGGTQTFVITGTNLSSGGTISFVGTDGTEVNANTTTYNSATQVTAVEEKATFTNALEPWKIKFTTSTGLTGLSIGLIYSDQSPAWSTSAGNVGEVLEGTAISPTIQLSATDADGDAVSYAETTSNLSGAGFALSSSGAITGTAQTVSGDTTTNFTVRATANSKNVDRTFNIITKNINEDALLFDATNLPNNSDVYTSNADGASVGLKLNNGNALSVNTAVTLSRINGVNDGTGTLANGAMLPNHSNLLSHYNQSNSKNYGNTFWGMVTGDQHTTAINKAWFAIYNGGTQTNAHIWWTWDLGANPSVKIKRMTNEWTWRTGSTTYFRVYGSNSLPNGGSNMTSSFVETGLTQLLNDTSLSATEDNNFSNTDYYRYYVFRLQATGSPYDYGIDLTKFYGDYY